MIRYSPPVARQQSCPFRSLLSGGWGSTTSCRILASSCRPCLGGTVGRNLRACLERLTLRIGEFVQELLALLHADEALLAGLLGAAAPIGVLERLEALEVRLGDEHGDLPALLGDRDGLALGGVEQEAEAVLGLLGVHRLHAGTFASS